MFSSRTKLGGQVISVVDIFLHLGFYFIEVRLQGSDILLAFVGFFLDLLLGVSELLVPVFECDAAQSAFFRARFCNCQLDALEGDRVSNGQKKDFAL